MKRLTILFFLLPLLSLANEKSIDSKIVKAHVFARGAELTRTANLSLEKGNQTIVMSGVSRNIDDQSIRVKGQGSFTILNVSKRVNYLRNMPTPDYVKVLEDSLDFYENEIKKNRDYVSVLNEERSLIQTNKNMKGNDQSLSAQELKEMAEFFRSRLIDIAQNQRKTNNTITQLEEEKRNVQNQLNEYRSKLNQPIGEIVVEVFAENATKAQLEIMYMTQSAGWTPVYDIRGSGSDQQIEASLYASVYQNTGVDWEDVNLTVSTATPSINGTRPKLHPWVLDFYQPVEQRGARAKSMNAPQLDQVMIQSEAVSAGDSKAKTPAEFSSVIENMLSMEVELNIPFSVNGDGKRRKTEIRSFKMNADYSHFAVPKLDQDAFLVVNVANWEQYNLLPGEANIFLDNTYVGNTYLDPRSVDDSLTITMGRDKSIVIDREKITKEAGQSFFGNKKVRNFSFEITVRNTKSSAVDLKMMDQIPISAQNDIEVKLINSSGASLDTELGFLTWNMKLKPGEERKFTFDFEVKYPKGKNINL
jgi:uncharacterized protein (TIGR02231 family)